MPLSPQVFYTAIGVAKETAWGDGTVPTVWLPVTNPRLDPTGMQHILDDGLRGVAAVDFDGIPAPGQSNVAFGGYLYLDSVPILLGSAIGADVVAGAGPYTHTFALSPTPKSLAFEEQQNVQAYTYAGCYVSDMTFNFNAASGAASYSVQATGKVGAEQGTPTAQAFTAESAISAVAGWQGSLSVAGGAAAILLEGSISLSRQLRVIHGFTNTAGGSQDVRAIYPQGLQVTARFTFNYNQTSEFYMAYPKSGTSLAGGAVTKNAVVLTLQRSANEKIVFTLSKALWRQAQREIAENSYQAVVSLNGIYNATDAGPAKVVVTNSVATAY